MSFRERAYFASPVWIQNLMISVYGRRIARLRYGPEHDRELERLERSELSDDERVRADQWQRLQSVIRHALAEVPYYRDWSRETGVTPESFQGWADLKRLPVVDKSDLRIDPHRFCASNMLRKKKPFALHTSGTTGTSLTIYCDAESRQRHYAFWTRLRSWWGVGRGEWRATLFGRIVCRPDEDREPFWRFDRPGRNMLMSSYHLSGENVSSYLRALEDVSPSEIIGYASSLNLLAQGQIRHRRKIRPKVIFTTADNLLPHHREAIEEAFECPVVDQYGCAEMAIFAAEIEPENFLVHPEHGLLEVLDEEGRVVAPGESGEAICTNFVNATMPLLRYRLGDVITTSEEGHVHGVVATFKRVEGRVDDIVYTPQGRPITRLSPIWKVLSGIQETQVVQNRIGELDIHMVVESQARDSLGWEASLLREVRKRVGEDMVLRLHYEDMIPKGRNGKFRAVVSNVNPEPGSESTEIVGE